MDVSNDQITRDRILLISGVILFLVGFSPWWLLVPLDLPRWFDWTVACGFQIAGLIGFFVMILGVVYSMEHILLARKRTAEGVAEAYGFYGTLASVFAAIALLGEMLLGLEFVFSVLMLIAVLSFLGLFLGIHGLRIKWNPWILTALVLSTEVIAVQILYVLFGGHTL